MLLPSPSLAPYHSKRDARRSDAHGTRLDGRDGGACGRLLRRVDAARRAELPDQRPALAAPFIRALGLIKGAAARVNADLGLLDPKIADAIQAAAREVAEGKLDDQFVVDVFQTGSGTSTNMNANEVIANRATEILGGERGSKLVHPNDHVNLGQSSNDVIPTAIHLAALVEIEERLIPALDAFWTRRWRRRRRSSGASSRPGAPTCRTRRRSAWARSSAGTPARSSAASAGSGARRRSSRRWRWAARRSAPASTPIRSSRRASARCSRRSSALPIRETDNHFQAQSTLDGVLEASGSLRTVAVSLQKIANDIRWLGSGPRAGLGELALPEVQPGSSIMPGKVNPVIAESVIQVVAQVIGNDAAICQAAQGSYFELNLMMPVAGV